MLYWLFFSQGIVSWLNKKTGPPAKTITTVKEAEKLEDDNEVVVLGFFKDDAEAKEFNKAADGEISLHYRLKKRFPGS